jgi:hypothetical protein
MEKPFTRNDPKPYRGKETMNRLIIRLIFTVFSIFLLSAVSSAEITGDLTNANAVMTGKTTFKLFNVTRENNL